MASIWRHDYGVRRLSYSTLSTHFAGVSTKTLTLVDTKDGSNQHEVGGPKHEWNAFRRVLGYEPRRIKTNTGIPTRYIYISGEQDSIQHEGLCSWYDTRAKDIKRSEEWRLYYQTNPITEIMEPGDQLVLARLKKEDYLLFIVIAQESNHLTERIHFLFGMGTRNGELTIQDFSDTDPELNFLSRLILDEISIEFEDPDADKLDSIIDRFGLEFPDTKTFSAIARQTLPGVSALDDADAALTAWLEHEEAMFRRLESRIVSDRLVKGWNNAEGIPDVDDFLSFSLRVQQRRKSRMGYSFERHLAAVFDAYQLRYDVQKKTEKGKRPDFLFPGISEYLDTGFNVELLTMLAAKSTCKDRWSQILPEAERIQQKHLITLEPGISEAQTKTMRESKVQLIVPSTILPSYTVQQRNWVWQVSDFVQLVKDRQGMTSR